MFGTTYNQTRHSDGTREPWQRISYLRESREQTQVNPPPIGTWRFAHSAQR